MKRRIFLRSGAIAAGLFGSLKPFPLFATTKENSQPSSPTPGQNQTQSGVSQKDIRSADYLTRVRAEKYLPGQPIFAQTKLNSALKISAMSLEERRKRNIVPNRGFCCLEPGGEGLSSGNGTVNIEVGGNPFTEQIPFSHESIFTPRKKSLEAPNIAHIFPQVRHMMLEGKYKDAAMLAYNEWQKKPVTRGMGGFGFARFTMLLELPKSESVTNYLRTVDFESTEVKVLWTDERGDWVRRTFVSRPDHVVVQWLIAPGGQSVNVRIKMSEAAARGGRGMQSPPGIVGGGGAQGGSGSTSPTQTDFNEQRLIIKGRIDTSVDNRGFANITRVVRDGGSARMDGDTLAVENASSVMLLTRIEYLPDYSEDNVEAVRQSLEALTPDYKSLLERARKVQSEMLNRVTVDFGDSSKYGLSAEELLSDQRSSSGYSGAFLKTFFEMCRYWFIITTGKYRSVTALTNVNTNLQVAPISIGNYIEGEMAYFDWVESLIPDYRTNAKNIFGMRGAHYP
ncbi:MAG TPA: glycoside hydrolase N-terminal domain-containing protein, partial [Bacteroidota bacterium]|nr:glycoside hydrolase N-terminal domain-containing protein [Bacteroidota bacterium]